MRWISGITLGAVTPSPRSSTSDGSSVSRRSLMSCPRVSRAFMAAPVDGAHTSCPSFWSTLPVIPGSSTITSFISLRGIVTSSALSPPRGWLASWPRRVGPVNAHVLTACSEYTKLRAGVGANGPTKPPRTSTSSRMTLERKEEEMPITAADIAPGDVLLFHGHGFVAWAIRKLDGTRVNHAAIALDANQLGEAAGSGLRRFSIAQTVAGNEMTVVRRLPDQDMAPVLAKANFYLDGRVPYAYQQIVLLALLTTTRKIPMPRVARRLVRSVLDHAAAALNEMFGTGTKTMICSEY